MNLSILRNAVEVANVSIDEKTMFTHKIMGEHKITSSFFTVAPLAVQIGDYIEWLGSSFYINQIPPFKKLSNISYEYTVTFEGVVYNLFNKLFMDEGSADFSYHGNAEDHLNLLLTNINSTDAGWTTDTVAVTESKTITYSSQNCRNALNTIAKEFELEWKLDNKAITMVKSIGVATALNFEYGRGNGLYSLTRGRIDDANVVTRVYGFGAAKNLNYDYRSGKKRLVFDVLKLEANTGLYGVREGIFTDDTVFPQRTGIVSGIDAGNIYKLIDTSIDFDINDYLLKGVPQKIVFKTGALSGYEFEFRYDHSNKEFTLIEFTEENDYKLPSALNKPAIGDTYTLVDIKMPQSYIDVAETDLQAKTQEYLDENSTPRVTYGLTIDEKYIRDNGIDLKVADTINLIDADLGVDKNIRVSQISYPLANSDKVTALISDIIPYTVQERLIKKTIENKVITKQVDRTAIERTRQAVNRTRELQGLVYDPDGYFDVENIKPLSIETAMLSVGSKSQNFGLNGVSIEMNVTGDPSKLNLSAGQLVHYEVEIDGLGYVWEMNSGVFSTLIAANHYYVYAKCSKTALTGDWYVSTTPKKTEEIAGYYLFNLGVLYNVAAGRRDFDFTKGMTFINGGTITSGKIQSYDGLNFFDLEGNKFRMGDAVNFVEWDGIDLKVTNAKIDDANITNAVITDALIDDAFIGDWILSDGLLKSAAGGASPVIELDSVTGEIRIRDTSGGDSYINGDGVFANGGNVQVLPGSSGITAKASVGGLGFGNVTKDLFDNNFLAGVFGRASNSASNPAPSYGGYFIDLFAYGLSVSTVSVASGITTYTIGKSTVWISCYNSSSLSIYMPANPTIGLTHYIKRLEGAVTIYGNGNSLVRGAIVASQAISDGDCFMCVWDGVYWQLQYMS
ncbi:phage tail protein [Bacteroidota bacterium]